MYLKYLKISSASTTLVFLLSACVGTGPGLNLPGTPKSSAAPEANVLPVSMMGPTASFSSALSEFAEKTTTTSANKYARNLRRDMITVSLLAHFAHPKFASKEFEGRKIEGLICNPRYRAEMISRPLQSLDATGKAIKAVASPPSDDAGELIGALGHKYKISIASGSETASNYTMWKENAGAKCVQGLTYDKNTGYRPNIFATREEAGTEMNPLGAITAIQGLLDTMWEIAKPAIIAAGTKIDEQRRADAIKAFFKNETNVKNLKSQIEAAEEFLVSEYEVERRRTAGEAVVSASLINDMESPQWKQAMTIAQSAKCKNLLTKLNDENIDPRAAECMSRIIESLDPLINRALDAADAYDTSLDTAPPKHKLSEQVDTLRAIALGEKVEEVKIKNLWKTLVEYNSIFTKISDTFNDENKKKFDDAYKKVKDKID